jgi:hypothetical protein
VRKRPVIGTEVFTFREGKMWIAAWRRFDIVAQGKTSKEALTRLLHTIAIQAVCDAKEGRLKTFGSCPTVPANLVAKWRRSHNATHMN